MKLRAKCSIFPLNNFQKWIQLISITIHAECRVQLFFFFFFLLILNEFLKRDAFATIFTFIHIHHMHYTFLIPMASLDTHFLSRILFNHLFAAQFTLFLCILNIQQAVNSSASTSFLFGILFFISEHLSVRDVMLQNWILIGQHLGFFHWFHFHLSFLIAWNAIVNETIYSFTFDNRYTILICSVLTTYHLLIFSSNTKPNGNHC